MIFNISRRTLILVLSGAGLLGAQSLAIGQQSIDLDPVVVVTDPDAARSVDWSAARSEAGTNYPNRWDDLTLLDTCLWLTPDEVEQGLGLSISLSARKEGFRCFFNTAGLIPPLFTLHVEVHADTEFIRNAQTRMTEGFARHQFSPVDVGTPELNVFVHRDGDYLYVYPQDGQSMWRLGHMEETEMQYSDLTVDYSEIRDFGVRYLRLLVGKHQDRLYLQVVTEPLY